jgi:hypothetical protein
MRNGLTCIVVIAAVAVIAGCQSSTAYNQSGIAGSNIRTVAIAPVTGQMPNDCAGQEVASIFARDLCAKGYTVIGVGVGPTYEPPALNAPRNPAGVASPSSTETVEGTTTPAAPATNVTGADGTMYVSVSRWDQGVGIRAKLVENSTNRIVWSGSGDGNFEKMWAEASTSQLGEYDAGMQRGYGGAMAVGAPATVYLEPKEAYATGQIAGKMLDTLPNRG